MYIKLNNGVPENYSIGELRRDNVNTSFPRHLTAEILAEYDVYAVTYEAMPDITSTQKLEQNESPALVDGNWVIQWNVIDKTAEELAAEAEAQAQSVRSERDAKLVASDWMVIKSAETGVALATEWSTYRQALRDITEHASFPNLEDSDWPVAP